MVSAQILIKEISKPAYIETQVIKTAGVKTTADLWSITAEQKLISLRFFDGHGRQIQEIYKNAGKDSKSDLVSMTEYDASGKESIENLPYAINTQLQFQENAKSDQRSFYSTANPGGKYAKDNAPFAESVYEKSPIQRLIQEGSFGASWQLATGKTKKYVSRTNTTSDRVRLFNPDGSSSSFYAPGSLIVSERIDEEGQKTFIFEDKSNKMVLKRRLVDETIQGSYYQYKDTYYVYSYSGLISMMLPPKVVASMQNNGWILSSTDLASNVYQFLYDSDGRVSKRKVPSAAWIYIIYDKLGRAVLLQNAKLRGNNKWNFIKYDLLNRPVLEGIIQDNVRLSYEDMQAYVHSFDYTNPAVTYYEKRGNGIEGYSNSTFPTAINSSNILSVYYYGTYDLDNNGTDDYSYIKQGLGAEEPVQGSAHGNMTAVKNKILGTHNWLQKIVFYNARGEVIQEQSNNNLSLLMNDSRTVVYNFDGTVKKKISKKNTGTEQKSIEDVTYDLVSRVKEITHQINNQPAVTLANYSYNELGQMVDKNLGRLNNVQSVAPDLNLNENDAVGSGQQKTFLASNSITLSSGFFASSGSNFTARIVPGSGYLQSIDYQYNIRGWLTRINNPSLTADGYNEENDDVFGMELLYEQQSDMGNTNIFNGLISGIKWRAKMVNSDYSNLERGYVYNYDKLGQLRDALFKAKQSNSWNYMVDAFSEKEIKYDLNGNLVALQRSMWNKSQNATIEIDQLSYSYSAQNQDQLLKVDDSQGYSGGFGFKDQVKESVEYEYDADGNLTKDKNKGYTYTYNELNKVSVISSIADPTKYISFEYSSAGIRFKKSVYQGGKLIKQLNYLDEFIYEGGVINSVSNSEGRVRLAQGVVKYEYFIKDHLGNVRVSFEEENGQVVVRQESSYYAFGMQHTPISKPGDRNSNLFNSGSEWLSDFDNDPDLYSTFFRNYDPVLGRFNGVDPLASDYSDLSVYNFAFNNPVYFSDPSGAAPPIPLDRFLVKVLDQGNKFGGSWTPEGEYMFTSEEEAFAAGVRHNDVFDTWDFTEKGHRQRSIDNFVKSYGGNGKLTGILLNEVKIIAKKANKGGGDYKQAGFSDELGQVMNLGGVVWGGAELGIQAVRRNNGPKVIGRHLGFGTQRTAQALRGTLGHVGKLGKKLGIAGYLLSAASYGSSLAGNEKVSTATHVNFGIGTIFVSAAFITAGTAAAPFVAGGALVYGVGQVGSWLYNGKTLEENFIE